MSRSSTISCFSWMIILFFSQDFLAQQNESERILQNIYATFSTTTAEQQYASLEELLVAAKAENHKYNYNFALTNLSTYAYEKKDYVAFTEYTEAAYQHLQNEPDLNSERVYYTLTQTIALESIKGNSKKALELYFIMLSKLKDAESTEYLSDIYMRLAADYRNMGDAESAILYNQNALEAIDFDKSDESYSRLLKGAIESTQGHAYLDKKAIHKAISHYRKSIDYLKGYSDEYGLSLKNQTMIESYVGLHESLLNAREYDQAIKVIKQVEDYQNSYEYKRYHTLELKGQYFIDIRNFDKGQKILRQALQTAEIVAKSKKQFPIEARIIMRMGDGKKSEGDLNSALMYYHEALVKIDTSIGDNLMVNPSLENIKHTKRSLEILTKKAATAKEIYLENKEPSYKEIAIEAYQSAILLLDKMKTNFLNQDTKYFIASNATEIYNEYIRFLTDQYEKSGDEKLISQIYSTAEKNKSTIAFDELQYKYALASAKIPKDLKNKHRDLKLDIAYMERLLNELESVLVEDSLSIANLRKKVFDLNEEFVTLDQKLNREYADELNDKRGLLEFPSMDKIRYALKSDELFVETFQSDDYLYFIGFDRNDHFLIKKPIDEINPLFEEYIEMVSTRPMMSLEMNPGLVELSNEIYQLTLKDILEQFKGKKRVYIVPDGLLSSIPFESLITDISDYTSFLIHDLNIVNLYSSRQIFSKKSTLKDVNILSLAPQFGSLFTNLRSCSRDSLSSLPFARKESEYINEIFPGTFKNSGEVNKSDLLDNINSHDVIHIATHACINESNPMMNEIHFSDSYLTNIEIENQLASPELIVLGACYTANGKYIEGQGLLSLSKGFLQAGSKCIQASLWAIDDYSSSEIIKSMFANLKDGSTKSEALRNAKMTFLEEADDLRKHPYFWAGIIQTGNDSPLIESSNGFLSKLYVKYIFGLLLLIGFAIGIWKLTTKTNF